MSWDIEMVTDPCESCGRGEETVFDRNLTWNLTPMHRAVGIDWRKLREMSADQAKETILDAVRQLKEDPERFKDMNPKNGWGSYDGLVDLLQEMLGTWKRYPTATVKVY